MKSLALGRKPTPPESRHPRLSSRVLTFIALALWVASLTLTGIVLYAKQQRMLGAEILATGWLSPLVGNFAWFANPLFLWSLLRLQNKKPAGGMAMLSVLLSLDTFRLSNYLLDEGGGSTQVYGYGWGVVLWFAALCVLTAAAGTRQIEARIEADGVEGKDEWLRPIGFALCISMLAAVAYLATQDRKHANSTEQERLAGLIFKRDPICSADEPSVTRPLVSGAGPLEVRLSEGAHAGSSYPFNKPTDLLKWGIPVVRVAGRDYSYAAAGDDQILTSVPASVPSAATLVVASSTADGRRQIGANLVDHATGRVVFEQVWREEAKGARHCPDYSTFPKDGEQPRKLMVEALAVQSTGADIVGHAVRPREAADNRVDAVIVSNIDALGLTEQSNPQPTKSVVAPSNVGGARRPWMGNRNCPNNVGWDGWGSERSPVRMDTGWPFMVGDRAYYPPSRERYNTLCAGDHAYLFFGVARDGKYYLTLEKRMLSDFRQAWSGIVVIHDPYLSTGDDILKVDSVDEDAGGVTVRLVKEQTGRTAVIKAPLRLSR
jgi:hypothetical protein